VSGWTSNKCLSYTGSLSLTTNCIYYFCLLIGLSMSAALLCFITVWHLALTYVFIPSVRWSFSYLITLYVFFRRAYRDHILPRSDCTSAGEYTTSMSQQLVYLCRLHNGMETGRAPPRTRAAQSYHSPVRVRRLLTCERNLLNNPST